MNFTNLKRSITTIASFAWLAVLVFAIWSLHKEWGGFHLDELDDALRRIGPVNLGLGLLFTAMSLASNAALDLLALRWLGRKLPARQVMGTALVASSFSMTGGGTVLGGGTIRLRFYGQYGFEGGDVAKITGFLLMAGWLGHAFLSGILLVWSPPVLPWLPEWAGRGVGGLLLLSCAAMWFFSAKGWNGKPLRFLPSPRILLMALLVSGFDWLCAGMALRVFLTSAVDTTSFLAATAVGQALGAASHVPGGAGVMELSISKLSSAMVSMPEMAGALMTYRLVYYLIPFALAVAVVGIREMWRNLHWAKKTVDGTARAWAAIAPRLAGMTALAGGFVLMLSANSPMEATRRELLEDLVPLPFVEASHFLSSIAGTVMVIVASGLIRRVRAAWWIAVVVASNAVIFSLVKGFDWEEALVLCLFLGALLPFKSKFYRHAALWTRRFSLQWWALVLAVIGLALWFGFYMSRQIPYEKDLWWQYSFDNDGARLLRAMTGSVLIVVFIALLQWLRPAPPRTREQTYNKEEIIRMVAESPRSSAALALVGDKKFLFNYDHSAFLMYGDRGRTRVALGDPVGDEEKFEGLYWRFAEQAQDEGMRVAIYQVSPAMVPVCVEMGLSVYKIGEEAMVPLGSFDLASSDWKKFRKVVNRMEREKWVFEIWQPDEVVRRMGELRAISDEWLSKHNAKEKGFSLGSFTESYLAQFPCAVLIVEGRVVAFGNLWPGNGREELSTDLMRHVNDAPNGVMDCLFVQLMMWGKAQGYQWFDLGMTPLAGLSERQNAPLWNRLGSLVYERGEAFYNFSGLRAWKSKFNPEWRPRYLALSKAWDLPASIMDITSLIGKTSVKTLKTSEGFPIKTPSEPPSDSSSII
ncbi:MAG: bifunctional lysylphosphatidylglycerol flippase/synthetase MprF [Luteolibacter sp.]